MSRLISYLPRHPRDRWRLGTLTLLDDSGNVLAGPWACLGKADNEGAIRHKNPTRDPRLPYGDHPTGDYRILGLSPVDPADEAEVRQYGPHGKLVLDPVKGICRIAELNGRYGLLIHGGAQGGPYQGFRPTYGCLRLEDGAMGALVEALEAAQARGDPCPVYTCEEIPEEKSDEP